jgi:hypothetical protein
MFTEQKCEKLTFSHSIHIFMNILNQTDLSISCQLEKKKMQGTCIENATKQTA